MCKSLKIKGKTSKYDVKFNNINLFKDINLLEEFKDYSLQDSICLFNALDSLQDLYHNEYGICITTILSTSTLSLKIFRKKFLSIKVKLAIIIVNTNIKIIFIIKVINNPEILNNNNIKINYIFQIH